MNKIRLSILLGILWIGLSASSYAQFYTGSRLSFGKNRLQFTERFWSFYRFEQIETYFYQDGQQMAIYTAKYASQITKQLEHKLDIKQREPIQFIIYNTFSELQESNIGLVTDEQYNVGGVTHIIGNKVFLYFNGDYAHFERQIKAGIAQLLLHSFFYGSSMASNVKNETLSDFPEWYINGLIAYLSEDWNTEIDHITRQGFLSKKYLSFNHLEDQQANEAGHALWYYIAENYGWEVIPTILYVAKINRNTKSGFKYVLGISYKQLLLDWKTYFTERDRKVAEKTDPLIKPLLSTKNKDIYQVKINPSADTSLIAYATNKLGKYKVYIQNPYTKRRKKIVVKGYVLDVKPDYSYPLLAWHPTGKLLSYIIESKGKIWLMEYDVAEENTSKTELFNLTKIMDFSYDDSGIRLVFSAVKDGQSDIFIYDRIAHNMIPITNDIYTDITPVFSNNSTEILFASNRVSDTLTEEKKDMNHVVKLIPRKETQLFSYSLKSPNQPLRRLTDYANGTVSHPIAVSPTHFVFLNNMQGITNVYMGKTDSTISHIDTTIHYQYRTNSWPITNYATAISSYDKTPNHQLITSTTKYKNQLFFLPSTHTPITSYQTDFAKQRPLPETPWKTPIPLEENQIMDEESIDINNYTFGKKPTLSSPAFSPSKMDSVIKYGVPDKLFLPKQQNADVEYYIDKVVNQLDFNFINMSYQPFNGGPFIAPRLKAFFKVGTADLFEDYRLTAGMKLSFNLKENDYFLSFQNNKKQLDKQYTFYRSAQENYTQYTIERNTIHSFFYQLKWPFSPALALKGTTLFKHERFIRLSTDIQALTTPDVYKNWGGIKTELVFDNTREKTMNILYGLRYNLFAEYYRLLTKDMAYYVVLGVDIRHYQKIHRHLIWANRMAGSTSLGNQKLIYYMGSVDSWFVPEFNRDIDVPTDKNYAYQTIATNLRGFSQNIRNGNSFLVYNSEIRFPIFDYFIATPIQISWIKHFQLISFFDIGTAWTGLHPYHPDNSLFNKTIYETPMVITIKNEKEPLVAGYGFGARTKVMKYFLRADMAWGIEEKVVQSPLFYLSLGLDF